MGFHGRRSALGNRAEEEHRDSHPGWDFMAGGQQSEKELRRSTGTHMLDGISWQEVNLKISI
jgi:hypothetical protein